VKCSITLLYEGNETKQVYPDKGIFPETYQIVKNDKSKSLWIEGSFEC
jgi:hypothetical protein